MRKVLGFFGMLASVGILLLLVWDSSENSLLRRAISTKISLREKNMRYERRILNQSEAHILFVPSQSEFVVTPVVSQNLETIEKFAQQYQAIATINGGFFDPNNQKTTSNIIIQGKLVANPKENERLVNNPNLKSYLNQIFNRIEFRRYTCNTALAENLKANSTVRYDIAFHNDPLPAGCQLVDALGGGPQLLPDLTSVQEGFVDAAKSRDALGSTQLNARSAVGITSDGTIILVMISQKSKASLSGMSLPALADFMKSLGAEKAMNLDGGSSASLYYDGKTFFGKVDLEGNSVKRPVKSVLLVRKTS